MGVIALALLILAQSPWPPLTAPLEFTTLGVGSDTCASWTAHNDESDPVRAVHTAWLLGFLTGENREYSRYGHQDPILRANQDEGALIVFADRFCAENPDAELRDAAYALWMDLEDRADVARPPL